MNPKKPDVSQGDKKKISSLVDSRSDVGKRKSHRKIKDLLGFYSQNYAGLTRGELQEKDPSLYQRIRKAGLLDQIPLHELSESDVEEKIQKLLQGYESKYKDLTRGELQEKDPSLYQRIRKAGLLDQIPLQKSTVEALLAFYDQNYAGLTRGQLQKKDQSFYMRMSRAGLLQHVPTQQSEEIVKKKQDDLLNEYHSKYVGLTRGQLKKKDSSLYRKMKRADLLEQVPTMEEQHAEIEKLREAERWRTFANRFSIDQPF